MEKEKMRSSNMELLRSFAMMMIVAYHIVYHCVNVQLTDRGSMARYANGLFNHPVFYKNLMILDTINTFGMVGNVIFVLISGYFMTQKKGGIKKEGSIDIVKISKNLLCQLGFASVVLTVASTVCFHMKSDTFFQLVNIQVFNSMSWFVGYYYAVILIAMLFLNDFLEKADQRGYLIFLTVSFAFIQFGWTGNLADGLIPGLRTLLTGVFLYALGGYIKVYDPLNRLRTHVLFLLIILTYFFVNLSAYNELENNIQNYVRSGTEDEFIQRIPGFANHSIIAIIIGVCLFEIFRRTRVPQSKLVNYLGKSTFMVYLLHDNGFFYSIFDTQDWITLLYSDPCRFILKISIWSAGVFACGTVCYTLYGVFVRLCDQYQWLLFKKTKN